MATLNWGSLEKSQVDPETIEEAIARLIAVHNADPTAHLGSGESLEAHKASEVIDHLAGSIVEDKIGEGEVTQLKLDDKTLQVYTAFSSLDAWSQAGEVTLHGLLGVQVTTLNSPGDFATIITTPQVGPAINLWSKESSFQTSVSFFGTGMTNVLAYIFCGVPFGGFSDAGYGFKILNGALYAVVRVDAVGPTEEYTTEITGITLTAMNVYKAHFVPDDNKIYFYVNGVLEHTEETNFPDVHSFALFSYYIKTEEVAQKNLFIQYLLYSREI